MKEFLSPNKKESNVFDIEKIKNKIKLVSRVLIASALLWMGDSKANAQSSTPLGNNIETEATFHRYSHFEMDNLAREQKKWIFDYTSSPKYRERLTKEVIRNKELGSPTWRDFEFISEFKPDSVEDTTGYKKVYFTEMDGTTSSFWSKMTLLNTNKLLRNRHEGDNLGNVILGPNSSPIDSIFPEINFSNYGKDFIKEVNSDVNNLIIKRQQNLLSGKYDIIDSLKMPEGTEGSYTLKNAHFYQNIAKPGDIILKEGTTYKAVPLHEFTHQSTDGDNELDGVDKYILSHVAQKEKSLYLKDPTEIMARMNVVRFLLESKGIYRAGYEDFNEDHYKKLLESSEILKEDDVSELFRLLNNDKESFIWIMNNITDSGKNIDPFKIDYQDPKIA